MEISQFVCLQIFASKRRFRAKKPNQFNAPRPPDRPKYALRPQTQDWGLALADEQAGLNQERTRYAGEAATRLAASHGALDAVIGPGRRLGLL